MARFPVHGASCAGWLYTRGAPHARRFVPFVVAAQQPAGGGNDRSGCERMAPHLSQQAAQQTSFLAMSRAQARRPAAAVVRLRVGVVHRGPSLE